MAARSTTEWMIHPSFVFKSFEDTIVKQNFQQYSSASHIVPEKIVESCVDQAYIFIPKISFL